MHWPLSGEGRGGSEDAGRALGWRVFGHDKTMQEKNTQLYLEKTKYATFENCVCKSLACNSDSSTININKFIRLTVTPL